MKKDTSWESVASWYDDMLKEGTDTYQEKVILPNLIRILDIKNGENILDLGCGQGFFSASFSRLGAKVIGVDASETLISFAKKNCSKEIDFKVASAENLKFIKNETIDKVVIVLAIQNMEKLDNVLKEVNRVLKIDGKLFLVMNHPTFRIPKQSDWGYDEVKNIQYRRIDKYLSESRVEIQMHPGKSPKDKTISFHRPLQVYFKNLIKNGFWVSRLEEWISHKKSLKGARQKAEDQARKEIPIFMCLEAVKK